MDGNVIVVKQGMIGFLDDEVRDADFDLPLRTLLDGIKGSLSLIFWNTHEQTQDNTGVQTACAHDPDPRLEPMDARMDSIS